MYYGDVPFWSEGRLHQRRDIFPNLGEEVVRNNLWSLPMHFSLGLPILMSAIGVEDDQIL